MDRSRRSFLATALAGLVAAAGCSDDSNVAYPDDTTTTSGGTTTATTTTSTTTTTTAEPTTTTTTTVPEPALAEETAAILDEFAWFAYHYDPTLEQYHAHCDQAIATIERAEQTSTLTETLIQKVENASMRAKTYFDNTLEPHFDVYGPVPGPHLDDIRTFAERGDVDRAHEELGELLQHFKVVSSPTFVDEELSKDPIMDRLHNLLATNRDRRRLFGFHHHPTKYEGWAYPLEPRDYPKYKWAGVNVDARRTMAPLLYAPGRVDIASISINSVPNQILWQSDSMPSLTVLVQRYGSPSVARSSYDSIIDSVAAVEGSTFFGRETWDDVFYYDDGDITYAYSLQVGSFILSMAPSRTPWNERPEIERDIAKLSWLWE